MMAADTLPTGTWTPDPARSRIGFAAGPLRGALDGVDATLVVAADGEAGLAATVRGARFVATALRREGELLEIDGEVTVNGRTLAVTGSGTVQEAPDGLVLAVGAVVDHRQFGLGWSPPPGATNEVEVDVHVTFTRAGA